MIRRIFLSSLGVVYAVAFLSLWVQIHGLVGSSGILPAQAYFDAVADSLGAQRWWRLPTIAWLTGAGDRALHLMCAAGVVSSALLIIGVAPFAAALAAWALYLSLYAAGQVFLGFQWDILLLESGFLAILYAPLTVWSARSAGWFDEPPRPVTWLLRLLVFKLMFLSGVVKLASGDATWWNLTALSFHYETTCLPTWSGWYMHQLPLWSHQLSVLAMFATELAIPFLIFGPRAARCFAAAAFVALQLFIGATGNYGFFNLLTVVLCLPLLDADMLPARWQGQGQGQGQAGWLRWVFVVVILGLNLVQLARALRLPITWPAPLVQLHQWQAPFHIVNGYGLFARMTTTRPEIILEGSNDGVEWRAYEFRWKPGDVARRPQFVQPHMPRVDWQMWFAALGSYQNNRWFVALCQRLLVGSPEVVQLLAANPFPESPPRYLRSTLYDYHFTRRAERSADWWSRERLREYMPTVALAEGNRLRVASELSPPE